MLVEPRELSPVFVTVTENVVIWLTETSTGDIVAINALFFARTSTIVFVVRSAREINRIVVIVLCIFRWTMR